MSLEILSILTQGADLIAKIREIEVINRFHKLADNLEAEASKRAFREVLIGFDHMATANQCEDFESQVDEMRMARTRFMQCTHLDPNGEQILLDSNGGTTRIPNSFIIAAGYFGNFVYFSARKERAVAILQAYLCGASQPEECVKIFSMKTMKNILTN
ncbi:hypothetical protein [Aquisalimonas asiatica]|uniref:hypothetical protein n=1 Tax=Aquisalimonas asiatica TaxID=406100 RepID=UPI00111450BE|nr:hypothetical protein [Aquisalimonas asiatica]